MKYKSFERIVEQAHMFGKMNRCTQTIEECAELTKELCKYQRLTNEDKTCSSTMVQTLEHIAEEIADVEICTCQLKHLFDIINKVDGIKEQKLLRTEQRLNEEPIIVETKLDADVLRKITSGETNDTDKTDKQENLLFGKRTHLV